MSSPLTRKLRSFVSLSETECKALDSLPIRTIVRSGGGDLISEGDRPEYVHLLLDGWAFRYKVLPDGGRQITAFLIPGDLCDIHIFILKRMDHSIGLLSDATIGLIPEAAIIGMTDEQPRIARALFYSTLVDEAILREWLTNVSRREPLERLAHLMCEMWLRMKTVGLVGDGQDFDLPLTQAELGDTVGLNAITVNRMLQRLRAEKLIVLRAGRLTITDVNRLKVLCGFDPAYLHLGG